MRLSIASLLMVLPILFTSCEQHEYSAAPKTEGWETETPLALELTKVNDRLTQAYENEDIGLLREMLAEEHVHNNVFGTALTKDVFLQDIESGILEFESYETPEIRWHISGDTAIATGWIEAVARRDGNPVPASRFLFTRIYVREGDQWKVLLFHNTMGKVTPPSQD